MHGCEIPAAENPKSGPKERFCHSIAAEIALTLSKLSQPRAGTEFRFHAEAGVLV
jgi:hypothetical protein